MKKMVMLVSLVILVFATGFSQAQNEAMMGLFFDPMGQSNCLDATTLPAFNAYEVYLVLIDPTFPELYGFEAGIDIVGPTLLLSTVIENYMGLPDLPGNYLIGYVSPMPMGQANLLITFSLMYMSSSNESVCFSLHGSNPSSLDPLLPTALLANGELISLDIIPGPTEECTALISEMLCGVTATDGATWDAIKSFYR